MPLIRKPVDTQIEVMYCVSQWDSTRSRWVVIATSHACHVDADIVIDDERFPRKFLRGLRAQGVLESSYACPVRIDDSFSPDSLSTPFGVMHVVARNTSEPLLRLKWLAAVASFN